MADTLFTDATANTPGTLILSAWLNDVDKNVYSVLSSVAGTNTITATTNLPVIAAGYTRGLRFFFTPAGTNTGATTINLSGLGAKSILKQGSIALAPGDIVSGSTCIIFYDGVQFQLINPQGPLDGTDTYNATAGTTTAYTLAVAGNFSRFTGNAVKLIFNAANTSTTPTLDVDGTGAAPLKVTNTYGVVQDPSIGQFTTGTPGTAVFDGTNWLVVLEKVNVAPTGQGRLTLPAANLVFSPYNGNRITINGKYEAIPSAGVSLAPAGTAANTTYYIYAFMTAGVMTLEFSTTTHATDTTTGVEIKSGDATRSLVGMARTTAGSAWTNTATSRFVISWFNRKEVNAFFPLTGDIATSAGGYTEINSTYRINLLVWSGELVESVHTGGMNISTIGSGSISLTAIAGTVGLTAGILDGATSFTAGGVGYQGNATCTNKTAAIADGLVTVGMVGATAAGSLTLQGNGSVSVNGRCTLNCTTLG